MLRTAVISALMLAACDVGSIPNDNTTTDGGGGGTNDGGGSGSNCADIVAAAPDGNHNPGQGCLTATACHNANLAPGGPAFSIAGTVYKDTAGTMPYSGATIFVTIGGTEYKTVSATNGNFWMVPALVPSPSNAMTGTTKASACPNTTPMGGALVAGGGDCNNCHRNGGTTLPVYVLP